MIIILIIILICFSSFIIIRSIFAFWLIIFINFRLISSFEVDGSSIIFFLSSSWSDIIFLNSFFLTQYRISNTKLGSSLTQNCKLHAQIGSFFKKTSKINTFLLKKISIKFLNFLNIYNYSNTNEKFYCVRVKLICVRVFI